MPIKFPCPHCKKVLSVKDHLAGKKGPCPSCKKILTVPMGSSTTNPVAPAPAPTNGKSKAPEAWSPEKPAEPQLPPEDAEAAAAAALADEPPPVEETTAPAFIDFNCPQCDEPLHLAADLGGKRAPCPECKRIIKVPEIKKVEKADWRKTNAQGLPSGARRPDEPVPEGAWGTATSASTVSREALEEADVLPNRYRQPLTVQQKVMRGLVVAFCLGTFVVFVGAGVAWWLSSRDARSLKGVEEYANTPAATEKVGREGVAALYIAVGEYHLRNKRADSAKEAQKHFGKAIETLTPPGGTGVKESERDALLADLALLQTDLAGTKDEIDATTRMKWDETQNAIGKTLRAMHNSEARLDAYRSVCRRLIARKEPARAMALARQLSDAPAEKAETLGVAGLEMLAAKQQTFADEAARDALSPFAQPEERPPLTASVVALAVALNRDNRPKPNPENELEKLNDQIGEAEGLAYNGQGDPEKARLKADSIPAENAVARLRAFTALAASREAKSDDPDLLEAVKLATGPLNQKQGLGWLQLRVVDLAARAGVGDEQLNALAGAISDPNLAGRARLIVLRQKLSAKNAGTQAPLSADPPTLAHYLSVELVARHSRSFDAGKAEDADRAFGVIGTLLGSTTK